ncbi:hypothetical protein [Mycobacterium sp. ACS4331]|uniref:hypothetical protein n=1 Tax=Mycobacterium sp. ACS4331 TaxID=1834121 RepID=UPI0008020AB7|nr:hypothetical protein [Mycobacterium sp. ACS4331]OBF13680.1 hypothetical protein A5727_16595 [Mycobacterium sp. ACS4331]
MDNFEREILLFVLEWAPYGGPHEEDVFPRFGLTVAQVRERVESILKDSRGTPVRSSADRSLINQVRRAVCWREPPAETAASTAGQSQNPTSGTTEAAEDPLGVPLNCFWRNHRGVWHLVERGEEQT